MYKDAQAGDLIDTGVIRGRLDIMPRAGQAARRKLARTVKEREMVFDVLWKHRKERYACIAVYDPPEVLAELGYEKAI